MATARVIAELSSSPGTQDSALVAPLFLRSLRRVEELHRSAAPLPETFGKPVAHLSRKLLLERGPRRNTANEPVRVQEGELGLQDRHLGAGNRSARAAQRTADNPTPHRRSNSRRDVA